MTHAWGVSLITQQGLNDQGFAQAGVGAVLRSANSKMGDVLSVVDFGAKFDGVTDDAAAINLTIAAVFARGGGIIEMPFGTAMLNGALNMANCGEVPITLQGHGSAFTGIGTTLIGNTGTDLCVIDTMGSANLSLRDFRIRVPNTLPLPSMVGILQGRTTGVTGVHGGRPGPNPSSAFHNYQRVNINMDQLGGGVGIYNIGSEQGYAEHVRIVADS